MISSFGGFCRNALGWTALWLTIVGWTNPLAVAQKSNSTITNLSEAGGPAASDAATSLNVNEIVERLTEHNKERAADLKGYTEQRHYTVTYHGFASTLGASLDVEAVYDAPSTKHFQILSESGSKLLADRVLKRLLATEQEAASHPQEMALTPENYTFTLVDQQDFNGRKCYVLRVEPRADSRLLYRGEVWVDADDYAVAQIEAQPARNPSFWIKRTKIHHVYKKTGPFWLPEHNESETDVRLGGSAVLTIDYGTYQTTSEPIKTR